jgi:hypothetical protein
MEENTEKKKSHRRRHNRSKNKDKDKVQNRENTEESGAAPEKAGGQQKKGGKPKSEGQSKHGRSKKHDGHRKQDAPDRQEINDVPENVEKPKREPEEVIFEFTWADAWGLYGTGYHIVIKDNPDRLYLSWSVDLKYGEMRIGQRLQEFLDDIKECGISAWDGQRYTKPGIIDGDTWYVKVNSLTLKCEAQGTNEYPAEWKKLLNCLHEKWTIPVSKREQWE